MVILKKTPLLTFPSELPLGVKRGFVAVNNSSKDPNYSAYKMKKKYLYEAFIQSETNIFWEWPRPIILLKRISLEI